MNRMQVALAVLGIAFLALALVVAGNDAGSVVEVGLLK